jgi:tryptophan halogenase
MGLNNFDTFYINGCSHTAGGGLSEFMIKDEYKRLYGVEWKSYKKYLPMKAARPFFIPHNNENIRPDTACVAMKYGWMWQIPVEDRYGCGYVFDSDYINGEQALSEVEELLGYPVESPKSFSFDAGNFENAYVKNCMAVGLAQGFIEPLESTSIMINCMNTVQFLKNNGPFNTSERFRKQFNTDCRDRNKEVMDFVHLHYLTKRQDSEFWRNFRDCVETPDAIKEKLELWNESAPGEYPKGETIFPLTSWMNVAHGLGLLNQEAFKKRSEDLLLEAKTSTQYAHYKSNLDNVVKSCLTHREFLDYLKSN